MMRMKLIRYLGEQFLFWIGMTFLFCTVIIFILDFSQVAQIKSRDTVVELSSLLTLAMLRLPNLLFDTLPFVFLFGSIGFFRKLNASNELVIVRTAGISAWQFIFPGLSLAFVAGVLFATLWQPISSRLYVQAEIFEHQTFNKTDSQLNISSNGLWVKENTPDGFYILHARSVAEVEPIEMRNPVLMRFNHEGELKRRISAAKGTLGFQNWHFKDVRILDENLEVTKESHLYVPTALTASLIKDRFQTPSAVSFWKLPAFIDTAKASGSQFAKFEMYFHLLLARPLILMATVLIAAGFSLNHVRSQSSTPTIILTVLAGFLFFTFVEFMKTLADLNMVSPLLAAWSPGVIVILLGITQLLHSEDG